MAEEPDLTRLRALEQRIAAVKGAPKPERSETGKGFSQGEMAWRMVIELVSGMLIGVSVGYGLDYLTGWQPVFLIVFTLLGFGGGVRTMLGTAKSMTADQGKAQAAGPGQDEGKHG